MSELKIQPRIINDHDVYGGFKIRIRVLGPVSSAAEDPEDDSFHYRGSVAIFRHSQEAECAESHLRVRFSTEKEARDGAFSAGKKIIDKYFETLSWD